MVSFKKKYIPKSLTNKDKKNKLKNYKNLNFYIKLGNFILGKK